MNSRRHLKRSIATLLAATLGAACAHVADSTTANPAQNPALRNGVGSIKNRGVVQG